MAPGRPRRRMPCCPQEVMLRAYGGRQTTGSPRAFGPRWPGGGPAAVLVVGGWGGSWLVASAIAREGAAHRRESLDEAAEAIAAELRAVIGREGDLAAGAR